MQENAARALCSLAAGFSTRKDRVAATPGALSGLVALLAGSTAGVQGLTAWALGNLAAGDSARMQLVAASPGCLAALGCLVAAGSSAAPGVRAAAARALQRLAPVGVQPQQKQQPQQKPQEQQ